MSLSCGFCSNIGCKSQMQWLIFVASLLGRQREARGLSTGVEDRPGNTREPITSKVGGIYGWGMVCLACWKPESDSFHWSQQTGQVRSLVQLIYQKRKNKMFEAGVQRTLVYVPWASILGLPFSSLQSVSTTKALQRPSPWRLWLPRRHGRKPTTVSQGKIETHTLMFRRSFCTAEKTAFPLS